MRRIIHFITIIGISVLIISCGTKNSAKDEQLNLNESLILSNQQFAFTLLEEVKRGQEEGKNILISPTSITIALLLAANGAEGITKDEILDTLKLADYSIDEINETYQQIQQSLMSTKSANVKVANSIWVRDDYEFHESYKESVEKFYNAEATSLSFSKDGVKKINKWVSKSTNGLINQMLEHIPSNTVAYLLNAIYFKADWEETFEKSHTTERPFYLDDGTSIDHPIMTKTDEFYYLDNEYFSAVKLPYKDNRFYATFILPKGERNDFYQLMNAENFNEWNKSMTETQGTIYLPRFQFEYEIVLNDVLQALGMETAFYNANFSQMFTSRLDTYIDEVKHKSFIEVNEEGTEAAAATSVGIVETAYVESFYLEFNRPFIFIIHDSLTNTILFLGEVNNPK